MPLPQKESKSKCKKHSNRGKCKIYATTHRRERNKLRRLETYLLRNPRDKQARKAHTRLWEQLQTLGLRLQSRL